MTTRELSNGATLYGGADVLDAEGEPIGVFGLLVHDRQRGGVYALSHAGVGRDGLGPAYRLGDRSGMLLSDVAGDPPLAEVNHPQLGARSICSLIAAFPVPGEVPVSAIVVSLDELGVVDEPLPVWRALDHPLRLVVGKTYSDWTIIKVGSLATLAEDDVEQLYADAIICEPVGAPVDLTGLGGAVFFTAQGHPVGMLIGIRGRWAIVAPLRPFMWRAGLSSLTQEAAAAHNGETVAPDRPEMERQPPTPEELELARDQDAGPAVTLNYARERSYRFALFGPRPAPAAAEIEGLEALRALLPEAKAWRGRASYRSKLNKWLIAGVRAHATAQSVASLRRAFFPLLLVDPDRPAREVMAALNAIDPFKPMQAADIAGRYLRSHTNRFGTRQRTNLWWLAQNYLSGLDENELPFDLGESLFRAARTRIEICSDALRETPGDPALHRELFAALETLLAYPGPIPRAGAMYAIVRRLASHAPALSAFAAGRQVLQVVRRAAGRDLTNVLRSNREFIVAVRAYEAGLARSRPGFESRFDERLTYVLETTGVGPIDRANIFAVIDKLVRPSKAIKPPTDTQRAALRASNRRVFFKLVRR